MKYIILLATIPFTLKAVAQLKQVVATDAVIQNAVIKNTVPNRKAISNISTKSEIENELNKIVAAYYDQPNSQTTWVKIKLAAENLLYGYFKNGKLLGTKTIEAYYVKIGSDTMTATDIINQKLILLAGIATNKPAEFQIIRVEKTLTQ